MLRFIIGRASSGKTYTTVKLASKAALAGKSAIILVPEQFSFECEKQVLSALGDALAQKVLVLSFSRICDEVDRVTGGVCSKPLRDSDIHIIMKRAIADCGEELSAFRRFSGSDGFARKMAETVCELKVNAVSADDILLAAQRAEDTSLSVKLKDTALIYSSFDAFISEKYVDPSDKLKILNEKLGTYRYFDGKTVFIDSFDGFTGRQFKIIERIFSQCADVYVSLNADASDKREYGVFTNAVKLKRRLIDTAAAYGVKTAEDIILEAPRYENETLCAVEEYMYSGKCAEKRLTGVKVTRADTVYDEAEFVARDIRKTVRETGARYRDFVIVARDVKPYIIPLKRAMEKNGVPCFIDERTPLSQTSSAAVFTAAAELLCGIKTENILKLYKAVPGYFSVSDIGELENYVYVWSIDGALWLKKWEMNPGGFVAGKVNTAALESINALRERAVRPLLHLKDAVKNDAQSIITALLGLIDDIGAVKALSELYKSQKESGDSAAADIIRQSYDAAISVLDSIAAAYRGEKLEPRDFCRVFKSALAFETVGSIPASLDEVTFGAADRIRPARPEYVYIMGANQGVFPRTVSVPGIFSNADRGAMIKLGLEIPDKTVFESINEEYLVYTNVCSAKRALTLSYSLLLPSGEKGEPSAFLSGLCSAFGITQIKEPDAVCENNLPETPDSAFSRFCRSYTTDKYSAAQLYAAFENTPYGKAADNIVSFARKPVFSISEQTAGRLFGSSLEMSPSKFDDFSRCRFMYFCKHALFVQPLQKSDFDKLQRGTVIHYVLERAVAEHGAEISLMSREETDALVDRYIDEYLALVVGFESVKTVRTDYIVGVIARGVKSVLAHMAEEFRNTDFKPVACELKIGKGGTEPLNIPVCDGKCLSLTGTVDRLDSYDGYLRVIDYKSGSRIFKLPDLLVGQNMQMLIYLYAVCKDKKTGGDPAAVLYMPAKRNRKGDLAETRMNGVIADDEKIIAAMDKSNSGRFIPKLTSKSSFIEKEKFYSIFNYIEKRLAAAGRELYSGHVAAKPVNGLDSKACKYCCFDAVCRVEQDEIPTAEQMTNAEVLEKIEGWEDNGC